MKKIEILWLCLEGAACLVFVGLVRVLHYTEPADYGFHCNDATLSRPLLHDSVSNVLVMVAVAAIPIAVVITTRAIQSVCGTWPKQQRTCIRWLYQQMGEDAFMFVFGWAVTLMLTEAGKVAAGRHRPHFLTVCDVDPRQCDVGNTTITAWLSRASCRSADRAALRYASTSFPSGHASLSFYSAVFSGAYMLSYAKLFVARRGRLLAFALACGLLALAWMCALTRVSDAKHHLIDVVAGALLGSTVAAALYHTVMRKRLSTQTRDYRHAQNDFTLPLDCTHT